VLATTDQLACQTPLAESLKKIILNRLRLFI